MSATRSAAIVFAMLLGLLPATFARAKDQVGETRAARIESPHPYSPGDASQPVVWTHTLTHPDATFVKLHFARFALAPGSTLRLLDASGAVAAEYTDTDNVRRAFWATSVPGDTVTIELRADGTGTAHGIFVDQYGYGTAPFFIESTCGTDQKEDVACYAGTAIGTSSRAVGRMLFREGSSFFACTGFLISPSDHFLSNRHCISSQAAVDTLEVRFNYQRSTCGGTTLPPFETFRGDRFVLANAPLDVALMTLEGRPASRYGFLPLSDREPSLGESLYLPQHPSGNVKKVSVLDCRVSTPRIDGGAALSDLGHTCDTLPGSSGSPVLDLANQVVGLHHIGACSAAGGENRAVLMSRILPVLPADEATFRLTSAALSFGRTTGTDKLTLRGTLMLGLASDGVAPLTQPVTLTLADADGTFYAAVVPAGSFRGRGSSLDFRDSSGRVANGLTSMRLSIRSASQIEVTAMAEDLDLREANRSAITVTFGIGDDIGQTTTTFRRSSTRLSYP